LRLRRVKGALAADLTEAESALLEQFLDELGAIVDEPDAGDPLVQRLFPAGYRDDAAAAADFRSLTQSSLQQERRDRYLQCREELPVDGGRLVLHADSAQRWLVVLNDMRLALGIRLGVSSEPFDDGDPDDSEWGARLAYNWLTAFQDNLLSRIAG
jgi:Domain of unknown function (DUF2017)